MNCPKCCSSKIKKNGHIHNGKQNHQCNDCGRQFVEQAKQRLISDDTKELVKRLLTERISLRGICRSVEVSLSWLMSFIVAQYEDLPDHLNVVQIKKASGVIIQLLDIEDAEVEADEAIPMNKLNN